jgi:hypothetical protein
MADLYCPAHPQTKLLYALKGGVGYCAQCRLYTRAAGVPEPKPTKATGKAKGAPSQRKGKAKAR